MTNPAEGKYMDVGKDKYPLVLGYDTIAEVLKAGPGVSEVTQGQRVAALTVYGSNQSYSIRSAEDLVPVPENLDPAKAVSLVLNYTTAYQMLKRTACKKIPTSSDGLFVVHAASGGVGTALLDLLRAEYPNARVLGTSSAGKKELVVSYGAEHLDYNAEDFAAKIKQLAPNGATAIFDAVGADNAIKSYSCLSNEGTLVIFGFTRDVASGGSILFPILRLAARVFVPAKIASLFGAKYSAELYIITQYKDKSLADFKEDLGRLMQLASEGKIDPVVQAISPIEDAESVYSFFRKGNSRGKLVLVLDEDYRKELESTGRLVRGKDLK